MSRKEITSDVPSDAVEHAKEIHEYAERIKAKAKAKPFQCNTCEHNSDYAADCTSFDDQVDGVKCKDYKRHVELTEKESETKDIPVALLYSPETEAKINIEVQQIIDADNQLETLTPHLNRLSVGEENTKKAVCILSLSGKSQNPEMKQIILLKAEPGSGKTRLMNKLTQGYKVKDVGRFSAHALDYSNLSGFEILRLKELGSMDEEKQGVSTIKFLSSDDQGYTVEITTRDEKTGKFTTEQYKIPPITTISSTTRLQLDSQFERRAWLFGMDETPKQTERIREWKADVEAQNSEKLLGLREITDYEFSNEVYKRFVQRFQFRNIIIPFPKSLLKLLGSEVLRIRGDMDKLIVFVKLYGQLNIKRLRLVKGDIYLLTPKVASEAVQIIIEPLTDMLGRIDKRTRVVFDALKNVVDVETETHSSDSEQQSLGSEREVHYDKKNAIIDKHVREEIAVKLGKSEQTIRRFFTDLENNGYVSSDGKKPKTFTLLYDVSYIETKLSGLLVKTKSADDLTCEMENEAQEWLRKLSVNLFLRMGVENSVEIAQSEIETHPSTEVRLTNPSWAHSQTALDETTAEHRLIKELPMSQEDTTKNVSPCAYCKAKFAHYRKNDGLAKGAVAVLNGTSGRREP